ncbi:MAG: LarC family nickel insertion protein, partial [Lachnospiraceae bacterium]|nr:LarC family nickel insertion protein [Lachnospiraceae bacterium]
MEQKLYLECYAGISGDMMTGALLDLGADAGKLKHTLESLHIDGYTVEIGRAKKAGLDVCDFSVKTSDGQAALDCDMEYLHGHTHDEHGHTHDEHGHTHDEHGHT